MTPPPGSRPTHPPARAVAEKHSVSVPAEIAEGVRSRVGTRGFSAYLASAAARQLERDALDDILTTMAAEHGPVDQSEVQAILDRLTGA